MTDLITRLIAGPGSRELDAEIAKATGTLLLVHSHAGLKQVPRYENVTTSIDAAVAFAVAVVGTQKAIQVFRDAQDKAWTGPAGWFDALPRYIVAEVLKARGDDR